jgi:hypothetical protein
MPAGIVIVFDKGGESKEGGGEGYESVGEWALREIGDVFAGIGGVIFICRLGCPCPCNGVCVADWGIEGTDMWCWSLGDGYKCVKVIPLGLPIVPILLPFPVPVDIAILSCSSISFGGVSTPLIIFSSALVLGSINSLCASTILIFFSPFSTSPFALLYIHSPRNVIPIPKACTGCMAWLNHMMAMQITTTRLMREAMEYVTGEVEDKITKAIMF